ncbi:hypothetical protein LOAG_16378 [Loa loa]|uniref:Uncharacterized protein n=1 Tax=Loa loa TaxID=7209 RepID=A0A1S0UMG9_LOALO|nr:hypothetical protein LOAG_16378 [Loa loa]EJD76701.1 hypothetical protein LOAG_16378 [Loa loa]
MSSFVLHTEAPTETSRHPKQMIDKPSRYSTVTESRVWSQTSQSKLPTQRRWLNASHWQNLCHESMTLFNANHAVQGLVIQHIIQQSVKNELDITPTMTGTFKATQQVKSGKPACIDDIPHETWKHRGQTFLSRARSVMLGKRRTSTKSPWYTHYCLM